MIVTITNLLEKLVKHYLKLLVKGGLQEFDVLNKIKT